MFGGKCVYSLQITQFNRVWYSYCQNKHMFLIYPLHCSFISFSSKTNRHMRACFCYFVPENFTFYFVLILILKINENSSEMLEAHLQPSTHTEIMRLLKNRKIQKKEKLVWTRRFLSGSWSWCVYIAEQPRLCKGVCMLMAIDRNRRCCLALRAIHTDSWLWVQSYINNFASL